MNQDNPLADSLERAKRFEAGLGQVVLGQERPIRLLTLAVFARGHALLEGGVGVGKTTLLRAVARGIGGDVERIEGTIDLMPNDLVYYTYLDEHGRPGVAPGPLLKHGEQLSIFFFNEINRARPQVHSLLLRVMAERSVSAFNREFRFPYLQVFADRNRVEKEETFELPAAARDRFMLEIAIEPPTDAAHMDPILFDPRFYDPDRLVESAPAETLSFRELNGIAEALQGGIHVSARLRGYVQDLWRATWRPEDFGIALHEADSGDMIEAGASPRGMSYLVRLARVQAWLSGRDRVEPEDVQYVFAPAVGHRIFLRPVYEYRRAELIPELVGKLIRQIAAP
ncbi:AAA family ATPase [Methylococcus geothermalis]|uniref:AAA domain-containing protein n=1 Tax=Methylococcus geothermalis TaxID=2681310 RepID=A0A858Q603_9GAMM|nr:MoxR family ATPase [Methylococcus geothermalis]QJD29280.1 AAA domain-containing protein [Methylococcus geothermalis]